jgi:hypothetical protein
MYDIFYVSASNGNDKDWLTIKSRYPLAQRLTNIKSYKEIQSRSFTKMFWVIWDDLDLTSFNLLDYKASEWDDMYVHVFKNSEHYDGICLFPKSLTISQREFHHRFFTAKKEIDIVASIPKKYNRYSPSTFDEYQQITDEMFWLVWPEVTITDNAVFDIYFSHHNSYDRRENHVFKNLCNDIESYLSGVILCSKYKPLSKREFDNQYAVDKKEHDTVVSRYRYNQYVISTYEEYKQILETETQPLFWCVWPEITILNHTIFDLYFDPNDGKYDHDRKENHVFKNLCNDKETYLCGLVLFSKEKVISQKEFNRRYLIDKKEHNQIVSRYQYKKYVLSSYEEYLTILKKETQPLFWGIWPEIAITDNSVFDLYFEPNDGKYDHDRKENHVFKHIFNNTEIYNNGLVLLSKDKIIGQREFRHRFLIEKKEYNQVVSVHRLYDVVFISYNEPNADENYNNLLVKCPRAKRVHGVKGIHQAHIAAAKLCDTDMIWIVDGDAVVTDDFNFDLVMSSYDIDCVHVWRSRNPLNGLEYGYGGVKLLPRQLTLDMDVSSSDMTTSISKKFKAVEGVSNITLFNTDEFSAWRSAFRECAKLASRSIQRHLEEETNARLDTWCTTAQGNYSSEALKGARAGRQYGEENKNNPNLLSKINDFDWLKEKFEHEQRAENTNT